MAGRALSLLAVAAVAIVATTCVHAQSPDAYTSPPAPPVPGPPSVVASVCPLALTSLVNRLLAKGSRQDVFQNAQGNYNGSAPTQANINLVKLTLGPCVVRTQHTHVNVDEVIYVLDGTVTAWTAYPNGDFCTAETLSAGQAFAYPRNYLHGSHNPDCKNPVTVLAFFTGFDTGTVPVTRLAYHTPSSPFYQYGVAGGFGDDIEAATNGTLGVDPECLTRCGLGTLYGQRPV